MIVFFAADFGGSPAFVALALGVVGFILGIVALKKRQSKGMAITGLILGLIVALVTLALTVFALLFLGAFFMAFAG